MTVIFIPFENEETIEVSRERGGEVCEEGKGGKQPFALICLPSQRIASNGLTTTILPLAYDFTSPSITKSS